MSESTAACFQLSPQQMYLWALGDEPSAFHSTLVVRIEGKLEPEALKAAFEMVIARHQILRTTFDRRPGIKVPLQVIQETLRPAWQLIDLRSLTEQEQNVHIEEAIARENRNRFALDRGPVVHSLLTRLGENHHVLIISLASACGDGASLIHLLGQVADCYAGRSRHEEVFQYADFSAWQNEMLEGEDEPAKQGRQYWRDSLAGSSGTARLPFETVRPNQTPFEPKSIALEVPTALPPEVRGDPTSFFAACWHLLQWRLTNQSGVVLGYVSSGRNHEEVAQSIGLFTRVLPLAYDFDGEQSFLTVLKELRDRRNRADEFEDYLTLDKTTQDLPISFLYELVPDPLSSDGLKWSILKQETDCARFHMQLRVLGGTGRWRLELRYDPNCFAATTAERVANCLSALIASAAQNPAAKIAELEILNDQERRQVVVEFNRTAKPDPNQPFVHYGFEEQAGKTPNQLALRFGEVSLTYGELNRRSNYLAHALRDSGVGPDVVVGLAVDRSAEMIVGLLAILKAGGAYVPLIPDNPPARLAHQLSETQSPVLLTLKRHLANLPQFLGRTILLEEALGNDAVSNPEHINRPDNTAYVIYTSGSTGLPKGVAVSHSNLANYARFLCAKLDAWAEPLNFATVSTLGADLGNTAIFPSLISGGCLHVIGYETAMAPDLFARYLERHPIDALKITPSHLSSLLAAPEGPGILPRKYLILGGEASKWDLVRQVEALSRCAIINHYGPTEATVGCCTFDVRANDVSAWAPLTVPVGRPIANAEVYICDARRQPVPVGVPGELCVAGAGIAKGYLNQPQQTAKQFLKNPFAISADARLYRTGDLARFLPDGNIEFLGRIDQQVKIRGFRVEPTEIEYVLKKHSAVRQVVVVPQEGKDGHKRLVGYVVATRKPAPRAEELRSFLAQELPDYMVPSAIVNLEALPLTRNGKVDIAALPSPDEAAPERVLVGPRNPVEQELFEIWRQVLKLDRFGVEDNFFDLGGHSLLATQVISRVRSTFHVQLPLRSLFDSPTVAELAGEIARLPQSSEDEEVAKVLRELEGLSDEEAERLLTNEIESASDGSDSGKA